MFTEAQNFFFNDGAFFTLVKPYFKNVLNSIKLPLGSIFYTTYHRKNSKLGKLWEKKYFVQWNKFFFEIRNYAMDWCHYKK